MKFGTGTTLRDQNGFLLQVTPAKAIANAQWMVLRESCNNTFTPDGQRPLIPSRMPFGDKGDVYRGVREIGNQMLT